MLRSRHPPRAARRRSRRRCRSPAGRPSRRPAGAGHAVDLGRGVAQRGAECLLPASPAPGCT